MTRIGIVGCAGRMGRANLIQVLDTEGAELAGAVEHAGHPAVGSNIGALIGRGSLGVEVATDVEALAKASDVLIEFSTPQASLANAAVTSGMGKAHVLGATGFDEAGRAELRRLAERAPIVWAPNMSQGVALAKALVELAAAALGDEDFDIEVVEMHHRHKVDAPSGTALALGEAAARGRGVDLAAVADSGRDGITGERGVGRIGFASLRGGDVVGEHSVVFAGAGERVEIAHKATDRAIFARGAVRAALWAANRPPGLYGIEDVLGLSPGGSA